MPIENNMLQLSLITFENQLMLVHIGNCQITAIALEKFKKKLRCHSQLIICISNLFTMNFSYIGYCRKVSYPLKQISMFLLLSSSVDLGFKTRSGQTTDYKIGVCCFSAKHAALRKKNISQLVRNQDNVQEWGDMSTRGLLFQ